MGNLHTTQQSHGFSMGFTTTATMLQEEVDRRFVRDDAELERKRRNGEISFEQFKNGLRAAVRRAEEATRRLAAFGI